MYHIAIPSYSRSDVIGSKSLATLEKYGIPKDKITIFVVREQFIEYKKACPGYQIIIGVKGLVEQREFIENWYDLDSNILFMDDDVSDLLHFSGEKSREPVSDLNQFISDGFQKMSEVGATIWGIYPLDNCLYAYNSKVTSVGLYYIVGTFYGQKNTRDIHLTKEYGSVEDRERTILRYLRDGKVLRFNRIGLRTKYFAPGGLMSEDRPKIHQIASEALVKKYPKLVRLKTRTNGYVDCQIRIKLNKI
jgi:hypothetical protein